MSDLAGDAPAAGRRPYRALSVVAAASIVAAFAFALIVPVYTDEIAWRMQFRALQDGGFDSFIAQACGQTTTVRPVWFMWPARAFSALVNQALPAPLYVRLEGQACALAWAVMVWRLIGSCEPDLEKRDLLRALAFGLVGSGLLPFLLVLSRPEQPILLALTASLLIATWPSNANERRVVWAKCAAIVISAAVMLSYHPKAVPYALVSVACLVACAHGTKTRLVRGVAIATVVYMTLVAAHYWTVRFSCPGDPAIARKLAGMSAAAVISDGGDLSRILGQMMLGAWPHSYLALTVPGPTLMSDWLPRRVYPGTFSLAFGMVESVLWTCALALALVGIGQAVIRERARFVREPRALVVCAMMLCVVAWGALQIAKNVYEASLALPILTMIAALSLTLNRRSALQHRYLPILTVGTVTSAIIGQCVLIWVSVTPLMKAAQSESGYPQGQPHSIANFNYKQIRGDIERSMALAGIGQPGRLSYILVDDLTYLALQESNRPLHEVGVLSDFRGQTGDPAAFLRSRNSDGVVLGCFRLPPNMRDAAVRAGSICAISKARLATIPPAPEQ